MIEPAAHSIAQFIRAENLPKIVYKTWCPRCAEVIVAAFPKKGRNASMAQAGEANVSPEDQGMGFESA